jgi:hypothetical protein
MQAGTCEGRSVSKSAEEEEKEKKERHTATSSINKVPSIVSSFPTLDTVLPSLPS